MRKLAPWSQVTVNSEGRLSIISHWETAQPENTSGGLLLLLLFFKKQTLLPKGGRWQINHSSLHPWGLTELCPPGKTTILPGFHSSQETWHAVSHGIFKLGRSGRKNFVHREWRDWLIKWRSCWLTVTWIASFFFFKRCANLSFNCWSPPAVAWENVLPWRRHFQEFQQVALGSYGFWDSIFFGLRGRT